MGKNCEEEMRICESSKCRNNGLCLIEEGHPVCYCVPDFHGNLCQYQYDECQLGVRCINGGTCIDGVDNFTCSCLPNLTGVFCECLILPDGTQNCSFVDLGFTTVSHRTEEIFTTISFPETSPFPVTTVFELSSSINASLTTQTPTFSVGSSFSTTGTKGTSQISSITELGTTTLEFTTNELTIKTDIFSTSAPSTQEMFETSITTAQTEMSLSSFSPSTKNETFTTEIPSKLSSIMSTSFSLTEPISTTSISENFTIPISFSSSDIGTTSKEPAMITTEMTETLNPITKISVTSSLENTTLSTVTERERTFPDMSTRDTRMTTSMIFDTTTQSVLETTIISNLTDCSQEGNECRNGGTCILEENGHTCLCPFDTEGPLCETNLGVRNAAFNGQSYLAHRFLDFSHIDFDFEAKTVTPTGLIFHLVADKIFMSLYIKDGFLEFKFSCGYQTMLLKELKTQVNNGYVMHISTKLHFSLDYRQCDAFVSVNSTLSMRGDQMSSMPLFLKPTVWLYFGGVPHELKNTDTNFLGFAGCMRNLKISGKEVKIFGDAEDGSAVTECSSLVCLSNPCGNGGTCVVDKGEWRCQCRNGYLGRYCEQSVCDNNPCLFGGTCVSLSKSGYICLCPYGKHGYFCENDIRINQPFFSAMAKGWSSYVAYEIPRELSKNVEIKFKFIPTSMDQISMLLFIGQTGYHDIFSDHVAVSFIKGYIMLTWNLGSGPRRIFTNQPLQKNFNDYTVHLALRGRRAWLYVENIGNITGRSPGSFESLDVAPVLYIGGHESRYFNTLPHDLPQHNGFTGCIFDVRLKTGNELIPVKQNGRTVGRAVNQCGVSECYKNRCANMAACVHHGSTFTCLCQDSWYGPLCLSRVNPCDSTNHKCTTGSTCVPLIEGYECDCPFGKIGKYCEQNVNITDVSFKGTRSFLKLKNYGFENNRFNVMLEMKPLSNDGLLLFMGKLDQFTSLYLQSGVLELRVKRGKYKVSHNLVTVRSSRILVQGVWHRIKFGVFGRKVYLSVENMIDTALLERESHMMSVKEDIFLGGYPDMSKLPLDALYGLPIPYTGCVRLLEIDSNFIPLDYQNIQNGQNIIDCDGTPCGGDVCRNGGTCWLDSFQKSHCNCPSPFYGSNCENIYNCTNNMCNNMGKCNNDKCYCIPGRNGFFCENEITIKVPKFKKGSYLVIDKKQDKRRGALSANIYQISINFTTANMEGMLMWHREENCFMGLGIEKGHLKLAYSTNKNNTFSAILWNHRLSDGLWHSIIIKFSPWSIEIDKTSFRKYISTLGHHNLTLTNGKFFLGNVPSDQSLFLETEGFFKYPFEGCIESFTENSDKIIDFTKFEGLDVDICHIF
ncbi:hypothetical protein HHI36_006082 [Cryptolaemus montrouzieri]|uniref:Protein eyes shut n=1 Tax=Cryptolaemus montrouzieri TaxID=559131 RepID=A0ABD2NWZ2_9CUCU